MIEKLEECPNCKEEGELEMTEKYSALNPVVYCTKCRGVFYGLID